MNGDQQNKALELLDQIHTVLRTLGQEFAAPNFTDRHGDGKRLLGLAKDVGEFIDDVQGLKRTIYVNLWLRNGVLGSKPMFHLSNSYDSYEEARAGQKVPPDVGWEFIKTFPVTVRPK